MFESKQMIEGPIEFTAEVEVDCAASDVFSLINVADPKFRHAQTGASVRAVEGTDNEFEMIMEGLDTVFQFRVIDQVASKRYSLEAAMEPQLFALVKSVETYEIKSLNDHACRVKLTTLATFDDDLSLEEVASEVAMMSMAVTGDLEKLATLAEGGVEALQAMEDAETGLDIEFDLGELDIDWDDIEPKQ
ncbi:hypothetical protein [uncultured Erythrobacter sp.]|uniref:hypothetical protein n=1 Tax=uncultured Erythrobacter sp. TaxID=263913 RepID=UPI0026053ACF|nr:hypothetical protein [uncultured Erythrobacter sp.]